jgi:hypothetical protein
MCQCVECKSVWYCDDDCRKNDARFHTTKICDELKYDYDLLGPEKLIEKMPEKRTTIAKKQPVLKLGVKRSRTSEASLTETESKS